MGRKLLYGLFGLAAVAGFACLAFVLWGFNYAFAYRSVFKSWTMLQTVNGGQWMLPFKQAWAYQDNEGIHRTTVIASVALAIEVGVVAAIGAIVIFQPFRPRPPAGGARMATLRDLRKAGFLKGKPGSSILLGRAAGKDVRFTGDSHFFVNGPSRSGKGRGFVLPNLLDWAGSVIVVDMKAENWNFTAKARKALGQDVFFFAPGSAKTHRWNPLDFVRAGAERVTDLQSLAATLVPLGANEKQGIWKETAQALCAACLAYALESQRMEGRRHLRSVYRLFTQEGGFARFCSMVLKEEQQLSPFILDSFRLHLSKEEEQQTSFEGNITAPLRAWENELVAAATSASDFDIRTLRRKPMSIYIGCAPGNLRAVETVIRLFIEQVHSLMLMHLPEKDEPHKLLIVLDEFYQFQAMREIVDRAPIALGYNVIFAVIAQNIPQFDERYTRATREAFIGNMDMRLFIGVGDGITADVVSESLGKHYVMSHSWGRTAGGRSNANVRWELVPLRSKAQLEGMQADKEILYVRGVGGIELDKINFYTDRALQRRLAAVEASNVKLPTLDLELLAEWPLTAMDAPSETALAAERERKRKAYAPASLTDGSKVQQASLFDLPEDLMTAAGRLYSQPARLLTVAQDALAHHDNSRAAGVLETLRKNPAEYGALAIDAAKAKITGWNRAKRLAEAERQHRSAMARFRQELVEARRAIIDDRAGRYARGQASPAIASLAPASLSAPEAPASLGPAAAGIDVTEEAEHMAIEAVAQPVSEDAASERLLAIARRFKMDAEDTRQVASVLTNLHSASAKSLKKGVRRTTKAKQAA